MCKEGNRRSIKGEVGDYGDYVVDVLVDVGVVQEQDIEADYIKANYIEAYYRIVGEGDFQGFVQICMGSVGGVYVGFSCYVYVNKFCQCRVNCVQYERQGDKWRGISSIVIDVQEDGYCQYKDGQYVVFCFEKCYSVICDIYCDMAYVFCFNFLFRYLGRVLESV